MAEMPKYTLTEAREAMADIIATIEFAFFTALADVIDEGQQVDVGPVNGGEMKPHAGRNRLIAHLVDRLVYDDDLVIYPAQKPESSGSRAEGADRG